jgi:signal transduction histidine kinase/putative methionine-R-sulfoxide reductase with GAF domain
VCGALLISGGIGLYFAYQENKVALASLQREKAAGAAARIEQFVSQIEQQLAFAALPQLGAEGLEQRRIEFLKLLRVVPAVTDIAQIDPRGREQLAVSRLAMDVAGADKDRSQEPAFKNARPGQTWFGPVYFRKETEPYMSIAVRSGGESGPVTVAEVNLKFIWDVVTRIKIGQKGKAYVVDSTGFLVADPDIGLVLRKTDLSALEQVKAAFAPGADDSLAMLAKDLAGNAVLTAHAPIEPAREQAARGAPASVLGWKVFVEQPVSEVYAALDATILRTVVLIVAGLLFSALAALYLARNMVRPINTLQEGAQRIGAGELDQKIEIRTGDELEALAEQFNRMTEQLRESYSGLERKVDERTAELQQSLERQTATAEILRVISGSPTDTQPVFDAILQSATKLCDAETGILFRYEDGAFYALATRMADPKVAEAFSRAPQRPGPDSQTGLGRIMRERRAVHIPDMLNDAAYHARDPLRMESLHVGMRSWLGVPMLKEGELIGAIVIYRGEPRPFTDPQMSLLQTFADQAVIAIENVRLFNETKESLEQQTAISDILRVISSSPSDVQPVFDAVAERAARICDAQYVDIVVLADERNMRIAAGVGNIGRTASNETVPLDRTTVMGRSIIDRIPVHVADLLEEGDEFPRGRELALRFGHRSILAVPLLRENKAFGTILLRRTEPRPFDDKHVAVLKTFADQAAIAIENVRLFNATKESLDQQTATSEILRVISDSPGDVKPILDAVAERATRLCDSSATAIYVLEGNALRRTAFNGPADLLPPETVAYSTGTLTGRAIVEGKAIHVQDIEREQASFPVSWELAQKYGRKQTMLVVPLMREGRPFGTMFLRRTEVRPFTDKQIALSKVFADQAAIGIENVRLFNETKEALEQQKASAEVLGAISSSIADTKPVFDKILESCERLFEGHLVGINLVGDDGRVYLAAYRGPNREELEKGYPVPLTKESGTGTAILTREVLHYPDAIEGNDVPPYVKRSAERIGVRSVIFAPMLWEARGVGAVFVGRQFAGEFSEKAIRLLKTFADQAVIAIQNARLFREIQEKSAQLEVANKHKSDFLANMSHELRTPLNAIIGFSEVLIDKMFGELNAKQADYMKDIHESGKHLLSLINDILDLSKIEAGRMDLEISTFDLPSALANAMTLVRERAQRHGIELSLTVDKRLGAFNADERKFKQIVLNLLSNAVKFTPDGGKVDVTAQLDTQYVAIAVKDTGIGIAPDDQAAVFEEFKQVGRDYTKKAEGTGLGLALTRRFVELHGGEVKLESAPGKGSTFTVLLPVRQ